MDRVDGLHCKACDVMLNITTSDGELCSECLSVVTELNHDLYFKDEIDLEEMP